METTEVSFDLRILLKTLRRFWWQIVLVTVLVALIVGSATFLYSRANPYFFAQTKYLVISGATTSGNYYQDNLLARQRASDIATVVKTDSATQYILQEAAMDTTILPRIRNMISVSVADDTCILTVTVRGKDQAYVKELTKAFELHLPIYISEQVFRQDGTRLQVVDYAFLTPDAMPEEEGSHLFRNVVLSAFVACLLAFLVAFLIQLRDRTVYSADTLRESFANTPLIGVIPVWETTPGQKNGKKADPYGEAHDYQDRVLSEQAPFHIAEAYRSLRTNLCYAVPAHDKGVVFGLTSARNGEGKTLTAVNLAISFAGLSKKVLLMEADMRMPTLRHAFGYHAEIGLSDLLVGIETDHSMCVLPVEGQQNLYVMPVGAIPPNPQELLASEAMQLLLQDLREEYDVILLDLPPVGVVADASVIAEGVDRYLMVARANFSDVAAIGRTLCEMEKTSMRAAGFILTDVPTKHGTYYYERNKTAEHTT